MNEMILNLVLDIVPVFVMFYIMSLGHSVFEKSGILNLAIDGVFFATVGAAVLGAAIFNSPLVGSILAFAMGAVLGLFMAFVLTYFPVSHGAVGLSLQFLGYGIGIVLGFRVRVEAGTIYQFAYDLFAMPYIVAFSLLLGVAIYVLVEKTKLGAAIRACGESPHAASALGVNVMLTRLIAGAIGFGLIGLGSSFFPLLWVRQWDPKSYTLGYGWLAFTVALAGGRHPLFLMPVAFLFSGLVALGPDIQVIYKIPADVIKLIPFVGALGLMLVYSITPLRKIFASPASLGKPYYKEEKTV